MKAWRYLLLLLLLTAMTFWLAIWTLPDGKVHLYACNVGQGDAILIAWGKTQILIDGGPDKRVIDCLSRYIPFWDRTIETVILTHGEKDHFGGLIEVARRYRIDHFIESDAPVSNQEYKLLKNQVGRGIKRATQLSHDLTIGNNMIYLDIITPNGGIRNERNPSLNRLSLIVLATYRNFQALLTGDFEFEGNDELIEAIAVKIQKGGVDYIKIPHHGSKNGLTQALLKKTDPKLAVISVGKNNWGHPHKETLDLINQFNLKVLQTDQAGDIQVITDGIFWRLTTRL